MMGSEAPAFDLAEFWKENELSCDKPFRTDKPRAPIVISIDDHWLLEEMEVPSSVRYFSDADYRAEVNRRCNDRCEEALGRRFFSEAVDPPAILRIEQVMGCESNVIEGGTPWLEPSVFCIEEVRAKLTEIEKWTDKDLGDVIFSTGGKVIKAEPLADGFKPVVITGSRGPATQATSILGTMNSLYWLMDYEDEMHRFFDVLADIIIRYHRIIEAERGVKYQGYYWLDDNCALFSPNLYETFCYPLVQSVLSEFAPGVEDYRYHHSDSEMRHLLPIFANYDFKIVNLGPNIPSTLIRSHLPNTVIHGGVAPNTLRDKDLESAVSEVTRDFNSVGTDGGLVLTTCGSISAGTSLESIRGFMWAVQEFCRYN